MRQGEGGAPGVLDLPSALASGDAALIAHAWRSAAPDVRADAALVAQTADALERAGRADLLDEVLSDAVAATPEDLWLMVRYARSAVDREAPDALARCDHLIVRFPNEGISYVLRGEFLARIGRPDDAEASYRAAVTFQPDFPWSHIRYAEAAADRGDQAARLHRLRAAFLILPDDPLVAWDLGEALIDLEHWDEAREILTDGLAANPGDPSLIETIAKLTPAGVPATVAVQQIDDKAEVVGVLVSRNPVIIHTGADRLESAVAPVMSFYQQFDRPVYFLVGSVRSLVGDEAHRASLASDLRDLAERFPTSRFRFLANDADELIAARNIGFDAEIVNNNAFVDENVFRIIPGVGKRFDAVYNARFQPYKRHQLATQIDKLLLLMAEPTEAQSREAIALLPKAMRNTKHFSSEEIAQALNMARCGLCLSATEGAMYASIEYLLCGLPVVTTPSVGGRDWFFSHDYVLHCDPEPAAIRAGVAAMLARHVSAELVRAATVARIHRERLAFFDVIERIFADNGQSGRRAALEFRSYFADKANYTPRTLSHFIAAPSP